MCDRVWCFVCRCLAHPTYPMRRGEGLFLPAPEREAKGLPGSGPTGLCTHKHTCNICDGHQRQAQLPFLLLNSRTAIIKCPPSPIKTNPLDCALLLSIGLTDRNDCIIHPPAAPSSPHSACQSQSACSEHRDSFLPLP